MRRGIARQTRRSSGAMLENRVTAVTMLSFMISAVALDHRGIIILMQLCNYSK
jgi:hypothetical protein